jgi:hypothetical protein
MSQVAQVSSLQLPDSSIEDLLGKKRKAHDSFVTKSFFDTSSSGKPHCHCLPLSSNESQMTKGSNISTLRKLVLSPMAKMTLKLR